MIVRLFLSNFKPNRDTEYFCAVKKIINLFLPEHNMSYILVFIYIYIYIYIYKIFFMASTKISSTIVFNTDNNKKCLLSSKSAY